MSGCEQATTHVTAGTRQRAPTQATIMHKPCDWEVPGALTGKRLHVHALPRRLCILVSLVAWRNTIPSPPVEHRKRYPRAQGSGTLATTLARGRRSMPVPTRERRPCSCRFCVSHHAMLKVANCNKGQGCCQQATDLARRTAQRSWLAHRAHKPTKALYHMRVVS